MPNHTEAEKARIRNLTIPYLPSNLHRMEARQDCPFRSLHHQQASYGQKNFANIGIVFEFCRAETKCQYHSRPLALQMSAEKRADLLSELESLDPPPYHDPANTDLCRSLRDQILETGNATVYTLPEDPSTPTRGGLSHLGLQSLARSGSHSLLGSSSSRPSPSTHLIPSPLGGAHAAGSLPSGRKAAATKSSTPSSSHPSASASSKAKGPGRPKKVEFEVTVYAYLRNGEPLTTVKAVGYLTGCKQVEFKFWQKAIADAFGFDLASHTRPKFHYYMALGDEWTDRIIPTTLIRGQPVAFRRENVRVMPSFDHLKPILNPPFNPNGVRPLSTLLDYCLGFPSGSGRSASEPAPSDPSSTLANIFGGPPPRPFDAEQTSPGPSRKRDRSLHASTGARASTPDDVIILTDSESPPPVKKTKSNEKPHESASAKTAGDSASAKKACDSASAKTARDSASAKKGRDSAPTKKGQGKAAVVPMDDIIDLTL